MSVIVVATIAGICTLLGAIVSAIVTLITKRGEVKVSALDALTDAQRQFADQVLSDNNETRRRLAESEKRIFVLEQQNVILKQCLRDNGIKIPNGVE